MPFVAFDCCGKQQEEFVFPDEVDERKTEKGLLRAPCPDCGVTHEGRPLLAMSLGKLPEAYGGKTVRELDKEYASFEGNVRHIERGTVEHRRHVEELREAGESRAKNAGYRDRKHMLKSASKQRHMAAGRA